MHIRKTFRSWDAESNAEDLEIVTPMYNLLEYSDKKEPNNSKSVTRKWNNVNDQSKANYFVGIKVIYNTKVLKSNLCDCNDAYSIKWWYYIIGHQVAQVSFQNCASFIKCITKIDGTTIMMLKI